MRRVARVFIRAAAHADRQAVPERCQRLLHLDASSGARAKVTYALNPKEADRWLEAHACNALSDSGFQRFGLDAEWWSPNERYPGASRALATPADSSYIQPSKRATDATHQQAWKIADQSPVNVVQLAVAHDHLHKGENFNYAVLVYHLAHGASQLTEDCSKLQVSRQLQAVLCSDSAEYVGMAVPTDVQLLGRMGIQCSSRVVDSLGLSKKVTGFHAGLGRLSKSLLGVPAWKSKRLSTSDWRKSPLSNAALTYAAKDALFSLQVHDALLVADGQDPGLETAGHDGIQRKQGRSTGGIENGKADGSKGPGAAGEHSEGEHSSSDSEQVLGISGQKRLNRELNKVGEWQRAWRVALEYTQLRSASMVTEPVPGHKRHRGNGRDARARR